LRTSRWANAAAIRGAAVISVALTALLLATVSPASALSVGSTWSGTDANNSGSTAWSDANNWSSVTVPANGATLSFPALTYCTNFVQTCHSNNDLTGASFTGISIDTGSDYRFSGNAITLGSGGMTTTRSGSDFFTVGWSPPIALGASQSWSLSQNSTLALSGAVFGSSDTLTVNLSGGSGLYLNADDEVGAFTATGSGIVEVGLGGQLNATDGNAVALNNSATLVTVGNAAVGPLSGTGGRVSMGIGSTLDTLTVNGAANLSSDGTAIGLNTSGASLLSATGAVTLGGSLGFNWTGSSCGTLTPGTTYTIVQGSSVSGTFSNAPAGAVLNVQCFDSAQGKYVTEGVLKIGYTSTSVTATVLPTSTTTLGTPSPSSPATNQTVTLTATVSGTGGTPTGTIAFLNNGFAISGCSSQPVDSTTGQATCTTKFAASSSPESLTASYTRDLSSNFQSSSTASSTALTVSKDGTSTAATASTNTPAPGQNFTVTATVTPADSGPALPSGTVEFFQDGTAISSCQSQPLTKGSTSSTATCTLNYAAATTHTITATYGGDSNVNGSTDSTGQTISTSPPDSTWTGQTVTSGNASATNWSTASNWAGGVKPVSGANGTISFPSLDACPGGDACLSSSNDLTSVSASSLQLADNYDISGNPITINSGGISVTRDPSTFRRVYPKLELPVSLGVAQTWSIGGNWLTLTQPLTAANDAVDTLNLDLSGGGQVVLAGDNEVGAITVSGQGHLSPGAKLNATDGRAVNITSAATLTVGGATATATGPLNVTGGYVDMSAGTAPVLSVQGDSTLDANSILYEGVNASGASKLTATGAVSVAGTLYLSRLYDGSACAPLTPDAVYPLVQGGSLSGTFANAPAGTDFAITCGGAQEGTVRIGYTATSVTATVLRTTQISTVSPSPSSPDTNQAVTLSSTVSSSSGNPTGTVEFDNHGSAISGCSAQPVDTSTGTATCTTTFTASSSPESLSASYSPTSGTNYQNASASAIPLTVGTDATSTALATSDANPSTAEAVTYTATVNPSDSGSSAPTGTIEFDDGGTSISGCGSSSVDASTGKATCQVTYGASGTHTITATYSGDTDFSSSSSPATGQSETVTAPTTASAVTAAPSSPVTNRPVRLSTTIASGSGVPTGTVEFDNHGTAISGCSSQPIDASNGVASCQTSFAASASPETLTATYTPASGSGYVMSSSKPTALTVGKDATTTTLASTHASPSTGEQVTYTATVAPADTGAAVPAGTVEFGDGGTAIGACSTQTLTNGTATCSLSYPAPGAHSITASYSGDTDFSTSASGAQKVTVATPTPTPTPTPKPPPPFTISTSAHPTQRGDVINPGAVFTCNSPAGCSADELVTTVIDGRLVTIGAAHLKIRDGGTGSATITLNRLGRLLLSDHRRLRVRLRFSVDSPGAKRASATESLTLNGSIATLRLLGVHWNRKGTALVTVRISTPGQIQLRLTASNDLAGAARARAALAHQYPRRFTIGQASVSPARAGVVSIKLVVSRRGRRLLSPDWDEATYRLGISYQPRYAARQTVRVYGLNIR
jgi:hypothetical protein